MTHEFRGDPFLEGMPQTAKVVAAFLLEQQPEPKTEKQITRRQLAQKWYGKELNIDYNIDILVERNCILLKATDEYIGTTSLPMFNVHIHPKLYEMKQKLGVDVTSETIKFPTAPHNTSLSLSCRTALRAIIEIDCLEGVFYLDILNQVRKLTKLGFYECSSEDLSTALLILDARYCIKAVIKDRGTRYFLHPQLRRSEDYTIVQKPSQAPPPVDEIVCDEFIKPAMVAESIEIVKQAEPEHNEPIQPVKPIKRIKPKGMRRPVKTTGCKWHAKVVTGNPEIDLLSPQAQHLLGKLKRFDNAIKNQTLVRLQYVKALINMTDEEKKAALLDLEVHQLIKIQKIMNPANLFSGYISISKRALKLINEVNKQLEK